MALQIEHETWSLEDGRCIVTPDGRFNLTYGTEKGSGRAMYPDFCKLDGIAQAVSALPELLAALRDLRKELRSHLKFDVRKHYSLMVADTVADKAIRKALNKGDSHG